MQKTILVTGASTGIGLDIVRILIANDFLVIATVRKVEDQLRLLDLYGNKIKVLILDVTDFNQVEKIPETLNTQFQIQQLDGLVNNAGVGLAAPFWHQDFSEVQQIIQVNVLSLMKVTQVLLPLLKLAKGRIVNISSVAGKSAAPFLSVYAASKHAVEGFSDGIRQELMLHGIKVIVVGPGSIKTPIWQKGFALIKDKYSSTEYAESFERFIKYASTLEAKGLAATAVSECVLHALTAVQPCMRYAPIPDKFINWYLPKIIPKKYYNKLTTKLFKLSSK